MNTTSLYNFGPIQISTWFEQAMLQKVLIFHYSVPVSWISSTCLHHHKPVMKSCHGCHDNLILNNGYNVAISGNFDLEFLFFGFFQLVLLVMLVDRLFEEALMEDGTGPTARQIYRYTFITCLSHFLNYVVVLQYRDCIEYSQFSAVPVLASSQAPWRVSFHHDTWDKWNYPLKHFGFTCFTSCYWIFNSCNPMHLTAATRIERFCLRTPS